MPNKWQVPTMKMLLTDGSGPIEMEVWRDIALVLRKTLDEVLQQKPDNIYMDITYFKINAVDTCKLLSPMRKIVTTPRTIIKHQRDNMSFAECRTSILPPEQALYVRDFSVLKQRLPFRVSLAGIINEVEEATLTQAGNLKKCFILQDQAGRYVTCAALGRHAQSPAISTSTEVIVYFGKAQEGFKPNLPGIVWIYDEAHVVVLRENVYCPPKLTLMLEPMNF